MRRALACGPRQPTDEPRSVPAAHTAVLQDLPALLAGVLMPAAVQRCPREWHEVALSSLNTLVAAECRWAGCAFQQLARAGWLAVGSWSTIVGMTLCMRAHPDGLLLHAPTCSKVGKHGAALVRYLWAFLDRYAAPGADAGPEEAATDRFPFLCALQSIAQLRGGCVCPLSYWRTCLEA